MTRAERSDQLKATFELGNAGAVPFDGASLPYLPDDDIVDPLPEALKRLNMSSPTFSRERKKLDGPEVVQLSLRRLGMTRRQQREYLARRTIRPGPDRDVDRVL